MSVTLALSAAVVPVGPVVAPGVPDWWLWVAVGAASAGALMSVLQHALRVITRHSLEQASGRRLETRNGHGPHGNGRVEPPAAVAAVAADLDGHVASVAVPRVGLNLLAGVSVVLYVSAVRGAAVPGPTEVAIGLACAALVIWVFSVAVPLAVARHAAEGTVLAWLWLIRLCHVIVRPLLLVLRFIAEVVRRLAGDRARSDVEVREAELLSLVEESEREGRLDEGAREMIEAVVEFRETTVEQIMTPRTELEALAYTDDLEEIKRFARDAGHSRIPVYGEDLDHIRGVLYVKDLLKWMTAQERPDVARPFELRRLLRKPTFVPETKTVRELLNELLEKKVHIAIALDEYGGTSGVVTLEDIVEEIFGEIQDEYEPASEALPGVEVDEGAGVANVDARTEIDEANDGLERLGLELPEHDDYDTVGGYVVTRLGRIPAAGDELRENGLVVTVLEAEPTRVVRVQVRRAEPPELDEPAA